MYEVWGMSEAAKSRSNLKRYLWLLLDAWHYRKTKNLVRMNNKFFFSNRNKDEDPFKTKNLLVYVCPDWMCLFVCFIIAFRDCIECIFVLIKCAHAFHNSQSTLFKNKIAIMFSSLFAWFGTVLRIHLNNEFRCFYEALNIDKRSFSHVVVRIFFCLIFCSLNNRMFVYRLRERERELNRQHILSAFSISGCWCGIYSFYVQSQCLKHWISKLNWKLETLSRGNFTYTRLLFKLRFAFIPFTCILYCTLFISFSHSKFVLFIIILFWFFVLH